jgi:chemotaxis signal transduction protein
MAEISSCRAPREDLPGGRIVVVKAGDDKIGFAVDLAEEIMMVKGDAVKAVKDAKSDLDAEILEGVTHDDDREIFILSVGRVCQLARVGHGGH